jgi:DNA-binding transcriptional LysR family regulator
MLPSDLSALSTFLAVAEELSFTRAAKRQGVSPSAVSHSMRALEEEVGVRLLARTTRSVSLTDAGAQLLGRLRPALTEVGETLEAISGRRNKAAGRVRLLLPRLAVSSVLAPKLGELSREYPDIILDVITDDSRRDIVSDGFDAGIHFRGIHPERHDRRSGVSGPQTGDRGLSRLPRLASSAEGTARPPATPLHQLPTRFCWFVSMGIREGK